ncbi:MAG: methyltransferase domain-containing protein [Candidatus Cloacimonetes bacterium]|nr:methyltransferase domain-containing protein [Candidatus Cloacimonadota bacterium]
MNEIFTKPVMLPFGKIICQTAGQGISSDCQALVDVVLQAENQSFDVLELGSGNGIIAIMLAYYRANWKITGIEIQTHLVALSKQNSESAGVKTSFLEADIKEFVSQNKYDIIVSNPPYFTKAQGRISPDMERAISRHEILCNMQDVLENISRNLKKSGRAYLIYPQIRFEQLQEISEKVNLIIEDKIILKNQDKMVVKLGNKRDLEC